MHSNAKTIFNNVPDAIAPCCNVKWRVQSTCQNVACHSSRLLPQTRSIQATKPTDSKADRLRAAGRHDHRAGREQRAVADAGGSCRPLQRWKSWTRVEWYAPIDACAKTTFDFDFIHSTRYSPPPFEFVLVQQCALSEIVHVYARGTF
jgi:hypothetical protein